MKIAVSGASGFLGQQLLPKLMAQNDTVGTLGRRPVEGLPFQAWRSSEEPPAAAFEGCDAVIHLAGETVAQRWTTDAKRRIRSSRVEGTRNLVAGLSRAASKPTVLICASAVGIYGDRGDEILTEASPRGTGFLADVSAEWEAAARAAESQGIRVVNARFGVVLGSSGGAFPKMATPFRLGVGGKLGSGTQWMPWVHVEDVVNLIVFGLRTPIRGPLNVTSPNPVRNAEFTRLLAKALHRPALMAAPAFALKLALGEMSEAVLASVRAVPAAAVDAGFRFQYADPEAALTQLARH